ncbi:MAG: hydrogenase maturation nickel metallochaperone HypA [Oceanidesulfovibrio sp.]
MHEMSITQSLLEIVRQELEKHGASKLLSVHVKHGTLANVVPEAMDLAWEVLTKDSDLAGATLTLEEIPLELECCACRHRFQPESGQFLLAPCPECGEELGHAVVSGKELYLDRLEAE